MTTEHDNRGRRLTDQHGGLLDAAHQAVQLKSLEGKHDLLTSQLKSSIDAVTGALHNVQLEQRNLAAKFSDVAELQAVHHANRNALEEMKQLVSGFSLKLDRMFKDFEHHQDQKWRDFVNDRDSWRREHEAYNEKEFEEVNQEVRTLREKAIRVFGYSGAVVALAGVLVAGFLWSVNFRFNLQDADNTQIRQMAEQNRALIDSIKDDITDIKLYLARGGRIPEEPYIPPNQRKANDDADASEPGK